MNERRDMNKVRDVIKSIFRNIMHTNNNSHATDNLDGTRVNNNSCSRSGTGGLCNTVQRPPESHKTRPLVEKTPQKKAHYEPAPLKSYEYMDDEYKNAINALNDSFVQVYIDSVICCYWL